MNIYGSLKLFKDSLGFFKLVYGILEQVFLDPSEFSTRVGNCSEVSGIYCDEKGEGEMMRMLRVLSMIF